MPAILSRFSRRRQAADPAGQGAAEIELLASGVRVVIVPELGGRITALELGGRQWLTVGDDTGFEAGSQAADLARGAATGFQECFPTVGPCRLVSRNTGLAIDVPALGEVRGLRPAVRVATLDGAVEAECSWTGQRFPYRFTRNVRVSPGVVAMRYAVRNTGSAPLPFIWAANVSIPFDEGTRLSLPENARARVLVQQGVDFLGVGAEHKWPRFRTAKKIVEMTTPDAVGPRYATHLAFDMPAGVAAVVHGARRLEVRFDASQVPNLGLAIRKRMGGPESRSLTLQPAIGVPDVLAHAAGISNGAAWLEPGAVREWELVWRAPEDVE